MKNSNGARKIRIGVWLHDDIDPKKGGAFGYYTELIHGLSTHSFTDAEIVFLSDKDITSDSLKVHKIKNKPHKNNALKISLKIAARFSLISKQRAEKITTRKTTALRDEIYEYADVVYYPTPTCVTTDIPYIYTFWDLAHVTSYAFPEFTMNGNFEYRKKEFESLPNKALAVFAESEAGKKLCETYLNITSERISVVPLFPSGVVSPNCKSVKPAKMEGKEFFIHYPAQYWAHKNHYNLVVALASIVKEFPNLHLVLTGSDKGNKGYIMQTVAELGLEKNVVDLGFVELEGLRWLYENSHGLVMPTLLGPTNMPLLEAGELGCPVACTDFPGHREQLGDYAYYFKAINPNDIAEKTIAMIRDKQNGVTRKYNSTFTINHTLQSLDKAFTELTHIRFCWDK